MKGKTVKQVLARVWVMLSAAVLATTLLVNTAAAQEPESISDAEMALGYYQPLAEQGEPYAQLTIGEIYMEGSGVEQDMVHAYAWFAVALHQGVEEAEQIMNHVFGKLSPAEQFQAQALAAEYVQQFSAR